jgi:type I restriction enzyme, S subunit
LSIVTPRNGYKSIPWLFGKNIEIPEEWEVKTFDDMFEFIISGTNARSDLNDSGEIMYIHYGDIHTKWNLQLDCDLDTIPRIDKEKVSKLQLLKEGDLIIADASEDVEGSGASILLKNVKNKKIVAGLHTLVLRRKNENISFGFMKYLTSISYVKIQITSWVTGAKVFGLTKSTSKKIKIPLPTFLEQQKIATIISNVDNLIESTEKVIENSKRVKIGLMQKLLTRGIGHTKFKKIPWYFGKEIEIPEAWNISRLNDVCIKITDGEHIKPTYTEKGMPFLTAKNIQNNGINFNNINYISKEDGIKSRQRCDPEHGDVLIVSRGATIGRTCIINSHDEFCLLGSVILIKSGKNLLSSFLSHILKSNHIQKRIIGISNSTAQDALYLKDMQKIHIPVPTIEEQQKIVTILSNMDSKITSQEQSKEKLQKLKKSLIQKLLTGEKRVKV